MIYLITTHNKRKNLSYISSQNHLHTHLWKAISELTVHKTVLYPTSTFTAFKNKALPNRVNMVFAESNRKTQKLPNVLVNNNYKDIINTFQNKSEDLYIIGTTQYIIERFAKDIDFIVDYTTEEIEATKVNIFDTINFADFILLKKEDHSHFVIRYFVREQTNFIGY